MKSRLAVLVLFYVALAAPAAEIPGFTVTPVAIPTPRTVNPYRIGPGSNGRIWFSDVTFRQVGFIAPSGAITAFKLVDSVDPTREVRPLAITEGPDGNGWFTISLTDGSGSPLRTEIGRVTPTGVVTRFPTPTVDACTVFGRAPVCSITVGPDGNLWFTETRTKRIGKITLSGEITEYLADGPGGEFFYEITAGPDGNLWMADSQNDIIRITPSGVITTFTRQGLFLARITAGPDGNVWFTDGPSHSIGRITPTGTITLFPTPSPTFSPIDIVAGSDGKLYFTENAADGAQKIGQFDPATGVINESAVTDRGVLGDIVVVAGGSSDVVELVVQSASTNQQENLSNLTIPTGGGGTPPQNFSLEKSFDPPGPLREGDLVTVKFTITNRSTSAATVHLAVTDRLPFGLQLHSAMTRTHCFISGVGEITAVDSNAEAITLGANKTHEFACVLLITEARLLSNEAELHVDAAPTGVKSNRVTLESIPMRTIGSAPLSETQLKSLAGKP